MASRDDQSKINDNNGRESPSLDEELQKLREYFDGEKREGNLQYKVQLVRRQRSDTFSASDCLFKIFFQQQQPQKSSKGTKDIEDKRTNDSQEAQADLGAKSSTELENNVPLISCLLSIHGAMRELLKQVKEFYKESLSTDEYAHRLLYFSVFGAQLISPIFLGNLFLFYS